MEASSSPPASSMAELGGREREKEGGSGQV
jgi:hypothetical protein